MEVQLVNDGPVTLLIESRTLLDVEGNDDDNESSYVVVEHERDG
jgi:hypothetical protein